MSNTAFIKAHGTQNDFVVFVDPDVTLDLTAQTVQHITDRRAGVGGDGVIRVATAQALLNADALEELPDGVKPEEWFMDYRNADGSLAEMCGNGVRVFAHVLVSENLVDWDPEAWIGVGTRAGRKQVHIHSADADHGEISVDMGAPKVNGLSTATVGGYPVAGLAVDMGNPHLAAVIPDLDADSLNQLPIDGNVEWDPAFFPQGLNVEVVTPLSDGTIHMRVHERGVGETHSCGTGTIAAVVSALADAEQEFGTVSVSVPGGQVEVTITEDTSILRGPSQVVARGTTTLAG